MMALWKQVKLGAVLAVGLVAIAGGWAVAAQLTGEAILQKVDEHETAVMQGSLITVIKFENTYPDGTTAYNVFGGIRKKVDSQPDRSLIYFKEPEDVAGTIFLAVGTGEGKTRMWLYLPALGSAKELVSEEQEQSFAGSAFSYKDVGSQRHYSEDYTAKVVGEEDVKVGDKAYPCYVLEIKAKPGADVDYPTGKLWVAKDIWVSLKEEYYNSEGKLELTITVLKLGEFEGKTVVDQMIAQNVIEKKSTKITFLERRRPQGEIPDSLFDPDNLASFKPADWGF